MKEMRKRRKKQEKSEVGFLIEAQLEEEHVSPCVVQQEKG